MSSSLLYDAEAKLLETLMSSRAERGGVGRFGSHPETVGIHLDALRMARLPILDLSITPIRFIYFQK